jgi:putative membrane-bound dehydrogenase-like protein
MQKCFYHLFHWIAAVSIALHFASTVLAEQPEKDRIVVEALLRMGEAGVKLVHDDPNVLGTVDRYLESHREDPAFLETVSKLQLKKHSAELRAFLNPNVDASLQVEAIRLLIQNGSTELLKQLLNANDDVAVVVANGLGFVDGSDPQNLLQLLITSDSASPAVKIAATSSLGRGTAGQKFLLDLLVAGKLPRECRFAAANAFKGSPDEAIREQAEHLQPTAALSGEPLPAINELVGRRGDGKAGKLIFHGKGTCAKCHKVHGEGKEVGPDLSEIGSKLSRDAMYVAILNPNAGISHNYEQHTLVTADGLVLNGLLVNKNAKEVILKTAEGVRRVIAHDDIEEFKQSSVSLMPENLHQLMSVQELLDLVDYLMLLKSKQQSGFHVYGVKSDQPEVAESEMREAKNAVKGIEVAEGLTARLFSSEPDLFSPSSIDVDHLGRVWVCEVVNYRHFRNPYNPVRKEGDRILVLEDTDGDHVADQTTVFYQGNDVNSAHGICVLGDRVIVSAGDSVFSFVDSDGDLKADRKDVLFTGIGGVEHDHGIHAFVPGPDGKLYFNFGNEGHQLKDASGQPIVDLSGRIVADHGKPYQQGMVFRCDPGGSNVETLAWNFRNNWEVCVDSFGTMWQSDNDDDGNRATRINCLMPYGNYGYRGEFDGASWSVPRTGMLDDVSLRHWHLNDPGVVPNVVQTGAGSPTGITKYEGDLLPARFHNQLIHCDPGPNSVRAFQLSEDGAGYTGKQIPLMTGTRDKWFRPVDVCVSPDGSLFVADWYDPGVGGHRMGDTQRGRIFRVTRNNLPQAIESQTHDSQISHQQLKSPNLSARFLAAQELRAMGADAHPGLLDLLKTSTTPTHRARALWVLAHSAPQQAVQLAIDDRHSDIRCVGVRIAKQCLDDEAVVRLATKLASDASAKVRREAVLSLRDCKAMASAWTQLAILHDGQDRWYLEALGIAAEGNWDNCLEEYLAAVGDNWNTAAGRDIVWRSRSKQTSELLGTVLTQLQPDTKATRFLRAFDFQADSPSKQTTLREVVRALAQ